jgi:O-antigen ligase
MSSASILRLLPASLALIPLAIAPGLLFYFDITPKIVILLMVTAAALFFTRENAAGFRALRTCGSGRWLIYLLAGQAASIVISTAFSGHLSLAITGGAWRRSGAVVEIGVLLFALLLAGRVAAARDTVSLVLRSITVACLLTALYGIAQFLGIDPLLPAHSYHAGEGIWTIVRTPSTLGNANFFANYLLYAVFCSIALVSREEPRVWKWLGAVASCCGAIAIVLSGTRAGILGLACGLIVLSLGASPRRRVWIGAAALSGVVLFAALAVSPLGQPLKARVRWSREDALGGGRLLLWRDSAEMIAAHWLVGFGPDNFGSEFPAHQSLELAQVHPDFYQESPHNGLLDAAAAQGLPGAVLSIAMLALGLAAAWRNRALCLGAALIAGAVGGQFSSPTVVTGVYQLAIVAVLCALPCRIVPGTVLFPRLLSWAVAGALLLFSAALLAADISAGSFKRAIDAGNIEAAVHRYEFDSTHPLPGFTIDLYASRSLAQLAAQPFPATERALAWQEALRAGERAVQTAEDRQNALFNLAQLRAQQDDAVRTEQTLRAAAQAAPNWFKPHWILAELLRRTGRAAEAREEARLAMTMDAGKDPAVVRTWQELGSPR